MYVTEVDKDKKLVVAIENCGLQSVVLEEGFEIGHLYRASTITIRRN